MPDNDNLASAPAPASFRERKAAQLSQERAASDTLSDTPATEAPDTRPPSEDGISEDVGTEPQGLYADDDTDQDDLDESTAALEDDDEQPAEDDQDTPEDDGVDWKKRYNDLRRESQNIMESRKEMEREHGDTMAQHLKVRYELEDTLTEVTQRAEYMRNAMAGNAQQYQQINWAQVPPDRIQEVQGMAQQAFTQAQEAERVWQQVSQEAQQKRDMVMQREAEIAKTRLRRTIPNWSNDTYNDLRDFATGVGMPAQAFNEITDPVIIEALHAYQQLRKGASGVSKPNTQRKAKQPRGAKAAKQLPRDERGKFMRAKVEPNVRGSFAEKHKHRLAMERKGR